MPAIAQLRTKPEAVEAVDEDVDWTDWTTIGGEDAKPVVEQAEATFVDGRPSDGWVMRRLFVYEELVGILVEVVDVAATSNNAVYSAAKIAELRGRLDEAFAVEDAVFSAESERVREGEYESLVRSFARVTAAVDNVGAVVVGRRQRRSEAAAKRWRSGVDRQVEVGRVRMLQREALNRLYVPARSEVIVIGDDDSSGDDEMTEVDSLAEEDDEEMHGVDDDPDSQVDTWSLCE